MKKIIQQFQHLDKRGLRLSALYWLHKGLKHLICYGYLAFSSILLSGILAFYFQDQKDIIALFFLYAYCVIFVIGLLIVFIRRYLFAYFIFYFSFYYGLFRGLSMAMIKDLMNYWFVAFALCLIAFIMKDSLFNWYLFRNVIQKKYLGKRKMTEPLPTKETIFEHAEIENADERMKLISQHAIKADYQDFVEIGWVKQEKLTGRYYAIRLTDNKEIGGWEDYDQLLHLVFKIYPFGIEHFPIRNRFGLSHNLLKIKLSRNKTFTTKDSFRLASNSCLNNKKGEK